MKNWLTINLVQNLSLISWLSFLTRTRTPPHFSFIRLNQWFAFLACFSLVCFSYSNPLKVYELYCWNWSLLSEIFYDFLKGLLHHHPQWNLLHHFHRPLISFCFSFFPLALFHSSYPYSCWEQLAFGFFYPLNSGARYSFVWFTQDWTLRHLPCWLSALVHLSMTSFRPLGIFSTKIKLKFTFITRFLKKFWTSGVSSVFLIDSKFYKIFLNPFSFIESSLRQYAAFFISNKFKEFDILSHSFWIRLSEYFSFSINGVIFSKKTTNVVASPYFSEFENLYKASGIKLKMIFGSFLFS